MIDGETYNLSDPITKRKLMAHLAPLQGIHEVTVKPVRATRRQRANAYYFAGVVTPFMRYLNAQGQSYNRLECHDFLKLKCLPQDVVNPATGEVIGVVPGRSSSLTIPQFAEYVDRCIHYLADMFGIVCESPEGYFAAESPNRERVA